MNWFTQVGLLLGNVALLVLALIVLAAIACGLEFIIRLIARMNSSE